MEHDEHENLTPAQELAVAAILIGKSITEAAEAAGVSRSTVHRWLRDDVEFEALVNRRKHEMHDVVRARLLALTEKAVECVENAVENGDEKTAVVILKGLGLLNGEPPVIGSDDVQVLEAQKEKDEFDRLTVKLNLY